MVSGGKSSPFPPQDEMRERLSSRHSPSRPFVIPGLTGESPSAVGKVGAGHDKGNGIAELFGTSKLLRFNILKDM